MTFDLKSNYMSRRRVPAPAVLLVFDVTHHFALTFVYLTKISTSGV